MSSARTVTVSDLATLFNYELRNERAKQWTSDETLAYVNKWMEFIHQILAEHESDLVKTGAGTFDAITGTELYDLTASAMGDLLFPTTVWLSGLAELEQVNESDRLPHVIAQEQGSESYSQPTSFYLEGSNIGLLPIPDGIYTVNLKYIPDYSELSLNSRMPFKNLFNNALVEGVKIIAKNREEYGTAVDAAVMELFQDRAMAIVRKRQKQEMILTPVFS